MNPFSELEDEQLMQKYQAGDAMAFEVLYSRHEGKVYSYLASRLNNDSHKIDEVFQNVFMKMHKSRANYNPDFLFLKWLYTICRSELLDFLKAKKMKTQVWDETMFAFHQEESNIDLDIEAVKSLNDNEKKALTLKYYSDHDYEEISKALNTTQANARKIVSRGIAKLKKKLVGGLSG